MVKCGVLFEVRTVFLYTIYTSYVFKELNLLYSKEKRFMFHVFSWLKSAQTFQIQPQSSTSSIYFKLLTYCYG